MKHTTPRIAGLVLALTLAIPALAQTAEMTDAEVRKVDKDAAKLTLKHGEIKSLDMPPMTMVFHVRDKAVIETLKAGDKVRFKAVHEAGKYTVTEILVLP
jgi:Cu(I)/Ag(I) efflux system periplasmic protein CusF